MSTAGPAEPSDQAEASDPVSPKRRGRRAVQGAVCLVLTAAITIAAAWLAPGRPLPDVEASPGPATVLTDPPGFNAPPLVEPLYPAPTGASSGAASRARARSTGAKPLAGVPVKVVPHPQTGSVSYRLSGSCSHMGHQYLCRVAVVASNHLTSAGYVTVYPATDAAACQSSGSLAHGSVVLSGTCNSPYGPAVHVAYSLFSARDSIPLASGDLPWAPSEP